jgi:hypothetical protein
MSLLYNIPSIGKPWSSCTVTHNGDMTEIRKESDKIFVKILTVLSKNNETVRNPEFGRIWQINVTKLPSEFHFSKNELPSFIHLRYQR